MIALGKTEKMWIQGFTDPGFKSKTGEKYTFLVNPETYNHHFKVDRVRTKSFSKKNTTSRYVGNEPEEWEFEILIDGTGVIKDANAINIQLLGNVDTVNVAEEVDKLVGLCIHAKDTKDVNNYLMVVWGPRVFKGILESLDLTYKLFKPDGTPIRVIAKLKVIESGGIEFKKSSNSDITGQKIIKGLETLALLSSQVYNDPKYYLDVAQANKLNGFRKIKPGSKMNFPPLT